MDLKHRLILVGGYAVIVIGGIYGAALIRTIILSHAVNGWVYVSYLVLGSMTAYVIYLGYRAVYAGRGIPRPKTRFGWGRIVIGAMFLFSSANQRFHLTPVKEVIKPLEPSNDTQAAAMRVTAILFEIGFVLLICSGVWRGLRQPKSLPQPAPPPE